jgi:hypothetical protein
MSAAISAVMVGIAPIVERYHCQAEVFALNDLVCVVILWVSADRGRCAAPGAPPYLGLRRE